VSDPVAIGARLAHVRERIARAASRARRDPASIRLVAISKTFTAADVRAAADAGQIDFGENKVQEGLVKISETSGLRLRWHLVGHLQSNKARKAAAFDVVHSIDSTAVVEKLDHAAQDSGRNVDVLIQVDLAGEQTKYGTPPAEVMPVVESALRSQAVRLVGLMVLPPAVTDAEDARPYFARLAQLRDELVGAGLPRAHLAELSMGMSHDFEVAIEEGATIVRIGSAIFGARARA
jgi:pyridoxal phosphate enzyme (YggS family)